VARPTQFKKNTRIAYNQFIRASEVRVIDEKGEQVGIMSTRDAIEKARSAEKDLVLITGNTNPPVAKIIELAKYKYQVQQKEAASRKKAKAQEIKEVRFTPFMGGADFEARMKKVRQFLEKGDKVRLSIFFKGRIITKKEFGFEMLEKVFEQTADIASVEMAPKMLGKKLIAQLMPAKKK
jgi:translation initiation factor IF-3